MKKKTGDERGKETCNAPGDATCNAAGEKTLHVSGVTPSASDVLSKPDVCKLLGWSRPRLDRRLESDGQFPVISRGTAKGGWSFSGAAILAYLGGAPSVPQNVPPAAAEAVAAPEKKPRAKRTVKSEAEKDVPVAAVKPSVVLAFPSSTPSVATRRDMPDTGAPVEHSGEMTSRQRKDEAQAAMLEDKLRLVRGELAESEEVRMVLGTMVAHLGKGLDSLPDMIVKKLGLIEENADPIRILTDELRTKMVEDLRTLFG